MLFLEIFHCHCGLCIGLCVTTSAMASWARRDGGRRMILEDPFMKLVEKVRHARKDVAVWEVGPEGVDRTETLVDIFIGFLTA